MDEQLTFKFEQPKIKVYAAGPFFNPTQLHSMELIEGVLAEFDQVTTYKPRDGAASAKKLNVDIGAGKDPSASTRRAVYEDNVNNISDAQLLVALIDDRDTGTVFEMGWAAARDIPIITFTLHDYGVNLMLAESVLAHTKGAEQLRQAVSLFVKSFISGCIASTKFDEQFKRSNLTEIVEADRKLNIYDPSSK
jgi:nucleoside 2-deoxyribosyltransferase